jgi:hypothetical protein
MPVYEQVRISDKIVDHWMQYEPAWHDIIYVSLRFIDINFHIVFWQQWPDLDYLLLFSLLDAKSIMPIFHLGRPHCHDGDIFNKSLYLQLGNHICSLVCLKGQLTMM